MSIYWTLYGHRWKLLRAPSRAAAVRKVLDSYVLPRDRKCKMLAGCSACVQIVNVRSRIWTLGFFTWRRQREDAPESVTIDLVDDGQEPKRRTPRRVRQIEFARKKK